MDLKLGQEEANDEDTQICLHEAKKLCTFIEKTTQLGPHGKPGPQLAVLAQSLFEVEAIAIFDADLREFYQAGEWFDDLQDALQNIYLFETVNDDPEMGLIRRVLRMGQLPIGSMLLRGHVSAMAASAISAVITITFDRYHALANESRTEGARRAEQLRTTVLDSLAHAYKTPLTAIEAASSSLIAIDGLTPAQASLVELIEDQVGQLDRLTTRLLRTARLEASDLVPHAERVAVAEVIEDVVASMREQLSRLSVKVSISRDDLSIHCDRNLLVALLTQYVDNAGKYAEAGTNVTIRAVERSDAVVLSVCNTGPVIPATDHERVFDRYFRSSISANDAPGTGIGLSVAKRAAQAHGGHVWVTSDATKGTVFYASLPKTHEGSASV